MVIIPIRTDIDVFKANRTGRLMAKEEGFNASDRAIIEIAISELATNIIKHAVDGTISIDSILGGMEIVSEDRGGGMEDVDRALEGGKSSRGFGIGLSGVKRMMDEIEIASVKDKGTRIVVRKWKVKPSHLMRPKQEYTIPRGGLMEYGVISIPALGLDFNGDAYVIKEFGRKALMAVIDGLGHGENAYTVAQEAADYVQKNYTHDLPSIIEGCHQALHRTRGVVLGLVRVDLEEFKVRTAGVGNIGMRAKGKNSVRSLSTAGIVGNTIKKLIVQEFPYARGDTIFLYSDGISDRFDPEALNLKEMEPQETAEAIARRYGKDHDDTTILVAREG